MKEFDYFTVSYDIRDGGDYTRVYDRLAELRAKLILESTWLLRLKKDEYTCEDVMNDLLGYIDDEKDGIFVAKCIDFALQGCC